VIGTSTETLRIDADVAESDIGELKIGQSARFNVPAFPTEFEANVDSVGIDARRVGASVRYPVSLRVNNPEKKLLPGMTATVRVEVARTENALTVREAALRFLPANAEEATPRSRVWLMRGLTLEAVAVEPGLSDGAFTEIRPVASEAGTLSLEPGAHVAIGLLSGSQQKSGGAGIKLGNR
jgi:HlyD family secretion protein